MHPQPTSHASIAAISPILLSLSIVFGSCTNGVDVDRVNDISVAGGETFTYDKLHRIDTMTTANGVKLTYKYDGMGRLNAILKGSAKVQSFGYDPEGNRTWAVHEHGVTVYKYGHLNRLWKVITRPVGSSTDPDVAVPNQRVLEYSYEPGTNRADSITYPGGKRIEYKYNAAGQVTSVTDVEKGESFGYLYHPTHGHVTWINRPNDLRTQVKYDDRGRLWFMRHSTGAKVTDPLSNDQGDLRFQVSYVFDKLGRPEQATFKTPDGTRKEAYRRTIGGKLHRAAYADDGEISFLPGGAFADPHTIYARDSEDRVASAISNDGKRHYYVYDGKGQLQEIRDKPNSAGTRLIDYTYDDAGNRKTRKDEVTGEVTTYTYDWRNLLTKVVTPSATVEYRYNADGHRTGRAVDGVWTYYDIDPRTRHHRVVQEHGASSRRFVWGPDRVLAEWGGGDDRVLLNDRLGSIRQRQPLTGTDDTELRYDVWGIPNGATSVDLGFAGELADPVTGLVHLRARDYDPEVGQFISRDPTGLAGGADFYGYADGDPVSAIDRSGLKARFLTPQEGARLGNLIRKIDDPEIKATMLDFFWDGRFMVDPKLDEGLLPAVGLASTNMITALMTGHPLNAVVLDDSLFQGSSARLIEVAAHEVGHFLAVENWFPNELDTLGLAAFEFAGKLGIGEVEVFDPIFVKTINTNIGHASAYELGIGVKRQVYQNIFQKQPAFQSRPRPLFEGSSLTPSVPFDPFGDVQPGGVLIDKTAELVDTNLRDIQGAVYDSKSKQVLLVGSKTPAAVEELDMDLFHTAIVNVYGHATPPLVSLDPAIVATDEASIHETQLVLDLRYQSIWSAENDAVEIEVRTQNIINGSTRTYKAQLDAVPLNLEANGSTLEISLGKGINSNVKPTGTTGYSLSTLSNPGNGRIKLTQGGINLEFKTLDLNGTTVSLDENRLVFNGRAMNDLSLNAARSSLGEASVSIVRGASVGFGQRHVTDYEVTIHNPNDFRVEQVTSVKVMPTRQHRRFGGHLENTYMGWIMYEADRVMKCLAIGACEDGGATGAPISTYYGAGPNSSAHAIRISDTVADYQNLIERGIAAGNARMWFRPSRISFKRSENADGTATIVFPDNVVELMTEDALIGGAPAPDEAIEFAQHFTTHYDAFAKLDFVVSDPDVPGAKTKVKIFQLLKDAMKAVALARFFKDHGIPIDTSWVDGWKPRQVTMPRSIPTAINSSTDGVIVLHGGGIQDLANTYNRDAAGAFVQQMENEARAVGSAVLGSRPDVKGSDIDAQTWVSGQQQIVAANLAPDQQTGITRVTDTDLTFPAPGGALTFARAYNSTERRNVSGLGTGWRVGTWNLEFSQPAVSDPADALGLNADEESGDTGLRAGTVRALDLATGLSVTFTSSMKLSFDGVDANDQVLVSHTGLNASNVPTFTPEASGKAFTLTQDPEDLSYTLVGPRGHTLRFDRNGRLLSSKDWLGHERRYTYDNDLLVQIAAFKKGGANASAVIELAYHPEGTYGDGRRIKQVEGPKAMGTRGNHRVTYGYKDVANKEAVLETTERKKMGIGNRGLGGSHVNVSYRYDENGILETKTDHAGVAVINQQRSACQANQQLTGRTCGEKDRNQQNWEYYYDRDLPTGNRKNTSYMNPGTAAELRWQRRFDKQHRATGVTDANGAVHTQTYASDTALCPNAYISPLKTSHGVADVTLSCTASGQFNKIDNPNNVAGSVPVEVRYVRGSLPDIGKPRTIIDARGQRTEFDYDADKGNVLTGMRVYRGSTLIISSTIDIEPTTDGGYTMTYTTGGGDKSQMQWNVNGQLTRVTSGTNVTTTYEYDDDGRLWKVHHPTHDQPIVYEYNNRGQLETTWFIRGRGPLRNVSVRRKYYDNGRLHRLTDEVGVITEFTYYDNGQVKTSTRKSIVSGATKERTTTYEYNAFGDLEILTRPGGRKTVYSFDDYGRIEGVE